MLRPGPRIPDCTSSRSVEFQSIHRPGPWNSSIRFPQVRGIPEYTSPRSVELKIMLRPGPFNSRIRFAGLLHPVDSTLVANSRLAVPSPSARALVRSKTFFLAR